jgi:UDP-N-acetylmuramyl pentapeptide phosphotransferase/UDP-N-acetylglucosamine-1-phosphate transferase
MTVSQQLFFGISLLLTAVFLVNQFIIIANHCKLLDVPKHRSSHNYPIPRGGGIVIAILAEMSAVVLYHFHYLSGRLCLIVSCASMVAMIGFIDDVFEVKIHSRLCVQLILSIIAVLLIVPVDFYNITYYNLKNLMILTCLILFLVWSTNLFNFMDGTDGFAAIEAIFVLFSGGLLLSQYNVFFGNYLLFVASIVLGFLYFNFPPAKVFMGDVGSYFLGFLIGSIILVSYYFYQVPLLFWFIIYAVFCFDSTVTLLNRYFQGETWYLPHRQHAYQRLQNLGWQHKDILIGLIILNSFLVVVAFTAYYTKCLLIASILVLILLSVMYFLVGVSESKNA